MSEQQNASAAPVVSNIKRYAGTAGQFGVFAMVTYPGEAPREIEFVGSVYGGPVIMVSMTTPQTFVREPERFGNFADDPIAWVRRFFS